MKEFTMDVTIQGTNVKVTSDIEAYARKKLDRLDRYLPRIQEVRVELSHENTRRGEDLVSAQITVRHARGAILRAEEKVGGDIKKAIDKAVDKRSEEHTSELQSRENLVCR